MSKKMILPHSLLIIAFVVYFGNVFAQVNFKTTQLNIALSAKGDIVSLKDKAGKEYLAPTQPAPLLSVFTAGKLLNPEKLRWQNASKTIVLTYPGWTGEVSIKVQEKPDYITLELVKVKGNESVEYIMWGPYPIIISKQIGETVGTVWDDHFGIGLQALNIKTLGGAPTHDNDIDPSFDIFSESSGLKDISPEHKVLYRGQTAKLTGFGSIIQAYTRNRYKQRIVENWGHDKYVVPAYPQDGGVTGSKIALWGAPQEQLLSVIEKIELQENLPHPVINGVWAKRSPLATSSYLIMGFGEQTIEEALDLTQKAGLKYLYHPGPFETWGHFGLNKKQFPDNWQSMKRCVDIAAKRNVDLGVHTLSSFITTNDPFVTPVPDKRLAKVGSSVLAAAIDDKMTTVSIASPDFFNQMKNNNLKTVMLGSELIRYRDVSASAPWQLLDCVRGAFGTKAQNHQQGDTIAKLMDHGYKVFLPNMELQDEMAANIARLFNQTGLKQISFDGLEGSWSTGMGQYATQLFVKKWYDLLKPELKGHVINDASGPGHYFWHTFTRMNWGEPWYAGFRESQTQYRLRNQDYYYRNLMPRMLGWFQLGSTTTLEDIEWLLARAAGFDAGFGLSASLVELKKNGRMELLLQTIAEWEKARLSGAFKSTQKETLQDINKEFHLSKVDDRNWDLFPVNNTIIQHQKKIRQPGEPVYSEHDFNNPFIEQPLQFVAHITGESVSASWEQPSIEINNYAKLEIPFTVTKGQRLVCDGKQVILFDHEWHKINESAVQQLPILAAGANKILIDGIVSGEQSPAVKIEFKTVGKAERISAAR
ncbi:MAG: hypothetical protein KF862_27025 [Chitinophagaceae bacterium]|nr:hypothetical protein [Chitinophagaceae bacterium]